MVTSISHSPAETEAFGEAWGRTAQHGLVIALCGELGAGKTQLVKGLARGLGITERVHSPTYTLLNIYRDGRFTLFHLDLFRLQTEEQISAAGLEEYLQPNGVTVIEWADIWLGHKKALSVHHPNARVSGLRAPGTDPKDLGERVLSARLRWV